MGVEPTLCCNSAVYSCKNIRLRITTVEWNTLNATKGQFTTAKASSCANLSSNSSWAEKICGWNGGHTDLTVWNLLNCTRIENAHIVQKKALIFYYVAVLCTNTWGTEQVRKMCIVNFLNHTISITLGCRQIGSLFRMQWLCHLLHFHALNHV